MVVLLVLLALIGTAYISSARTDRVASNTSLQNLNINLLADCRRRRRRGRHRQTKHEHKRPAKSGLNEQYSHRRPCAVVECDQGFRNGERFRPLRKAHLKTPGSFRSFGRR